MSSKKVLKAMEARDWTKVKELIATTSWTPQDLDQKHGVRTELIFKYVLLFDSCFVFLF